MAPVYDTWNPGLMPTFKYEIACKLPWVWWYLPTCGPGITRRLAVFMDYSNLAFNCNCRAV